MNKKPLVAAVLAAMTTTQSTLVQAYPAGDEFQVSNGITSDIAMHSDGSYVITWTSPDDGSDGQRTGVYARRYDASGNEVGSQFRVNTYTKNHQRNPSIAMDQIGNFVITWESWAQDGSGGGIYAQRFDANANNVGSEFQVHTTTHSNQTIPSVAMDDDGDFVIAWKSGHHNTGSPDYVVRAQKFNADGSAFGVEHLLDNTGNPDINPRVVMDSDGDFIVSWGVLYDYTLMAQRFDSMNNPAGVNFQLASNANTYWHAIDMDSDGDFVIAWTDHYFSELDGDDAGVFAQRFNATGNAVGSVFQVNTYTTGDQFVSDVAMQNNGNFTITWRGEGHEDVDGIYMQRFDSASMKIGAETQINNYTTGFQTSADIEINSEGNFIVSWSGIGISGSGVYARRFITTPKPVNDFNADGNSDLLWHNDLTSSNLLWFMNGSAKTTAGISNAINNQWVIAAILDSNGDGYADILWRHPDGRNVIWQMQDNTVLAVGSLPSIPDNNWHVTGSGDVNDDGKEDIIWRHQGDGRNAIWQLDGFDVSSGNIVAQPNLDWQIAAVGDSNNDLFADLFWHNQTTGQTAIWLMNGFDSTPGNLLTLGDTQWQVAGMGDVNNDNKGDIIWRHQGDGRNVIWQLDGHNTPTSSSINQVPNLNWQIEQVGDTDGDNKADIIWRNNVTGQNILWQMDGFMSTPAGLSIVDPNNWEISP